MAAYENIAVELMRALNFYRFSNPSSTLSDMWFCGGGAVIQPLAVTIGEMLNIQLHSADELVLDGETMWPNDRWYEISAGASGAAPAPREVAKYRNVGVYLGIRAACERIGLLGAMRAALPGQWDRLLALVTYVIDDRQPARSSSLGGATTTTAGSRGRSPTRPPRASTPSSPSSTGEGTTSWRGSTRST